MTGSGWKMMTELNERMVVTLPWPDSVLSPNSPKHHWRHRQAAKVLARETAMILAMETGVKLNTEKELQLTVRFRPPDRRRRDMDNLLSSEKQQIDSICQVVGVDDSQIRRIIMEWGDVVAGGEVHLKLEVVE